MYLLMFLSSVISTIMVILWMFLMIRYRKQFAGMLEGVDEKIFILKDIYFVGLGATEVYEQIIGKRISTTDKAVEKMKHLGEVFGRDKAELNYYVTVAAKISFVMTMLPLGLMLGCVMKSAVWYLIGIGFTLVVVYSIQSSINNAMERKKEEILSEFPRMVSKMTMLINAGMLVRKAWDEVAFSNYDHVLYEEMRFTSKDIQEGKSVADAMHSFADRCGIREMRKFSSIYVQAVNRGAAESVASMKIMAEEAWDQKKQISKQRGEIASQKLMIPNMLMFVGIMAIVVVPLIASMMKNI